MLFHSWPRLTNSQACLAREGHDMDHCSALFGTARREPRGKSCNSSPQCHR